MNNAAKVRDELWRVMLIVPKAHIAAFEAALDDAATALTSFEARGGWRIEALVAGKPDVAALETRVMVAAAALGVAPPQIAIEPLPETDWVAAARAGFPAIRVGRYHVHGSHLPALSAGVIDLEIDAGLAFGSGEHETTRGCLLALDALARRPRRVAAALDMGCGSGILALAIARTWGARVVAADVDAVAVRTARDNARRNRVGNRVSAVRSDGYRGATVRMRAPYDLVVANILARPLIRMAPGLARCLAPDGVAVLSGVLARQQRGVLAAHRAHGLALVRRVVVGDWPTLLLAHRPSAKAERLRVA